MKTELYYLTLVSALTALLWVPYILNRIAVRGLIKAVGYSDETPHSPWAQRMMKAHANAVENLVVFAALVLVADAAGTTNATITGACMVYFWARVVHALTYTLAIPWVRTLSFALGFFAQATIATQLLMN
jgi:uncharacterized MAPEG superfamily protein